MATHNGERYIREQIDSILCQLSSDDEVVISDDGSTDHTLDIVGSYNDRRLKLHHFGQPTKSKYLHLYVTRNFENALFHAEGDYIFLSDQDDVWQSNKVIACMEKLSNEDCLLLIHNANRWGDSSVLDANMGGVIYPNGFNFRNYLCKRPTYFGCLMAFRKELLKSVLPFPQGLLVHDYWIGMIAEHVGKVVFVDDCLIKYREHSNNTSQREIPSFTYRLRYRFYNLCHLAARLIQIKL